MEKRIRASKIVHVPATPLTEHSGRKKHLSDDEIFEQVKHTNPGVTKEEFSKALKKVRESPKCPLCGGPMSKLDAAARIRIAVSRGFFGTAGKNHECDLCGHLE